MSEQSEPDKDITIQETAGTPEETLAEEITKDIETGAKPKKPRSEAQKAAFENPNPSAIAKIDVSKWRSGAVIEMHPGSKRLNTHKNNQERCTDRNSEKNG